MEDKNPRCFQYAMCVAHRVLFESSVVPQISPLLGCCVDFCRKLQAAFRALFDRRIQRHRSSFTASGTPFPTMTLSRWSSNLLRSIVRWLTARTLSTETLNRFDEQKGGDTMRPSCGSESTPPTTDGETIKTMFAFVDRPLSHEEALFPLAYGMLLYQNSVQVLYLLSAIYQPQNHFCIAIDSKASTVFKREMEIIANCFPNIHIIYVPPIRWCGFSVFKGVYSCLETLTSLKADWGYYQYLSGTDLPLKTNLEMVRIFRALNGSFNSVIADYPLYRFSNQTRWSPLFIYKSSLSATFSRTDADYIVRHRKTIELLHFLSKTECSDESVWTTLAGNPKQLSVPGGFDAAVFRRKLSDIYNTVDFYRGRTRFGLYQPEKYYISRFQTWFFNYRPCYGKLVQFSCVYGVRDLAGIMARPELVAHKFYLDYQPATYFCVYEALRRRTLDPNWEFTADGYSILPGPRMMRGERLEDMQLLSPTGLDFF